MRSFGDAALTLFAFISPLVAIWLVWSLFDPRHQAAAALGLCLGIAGALISGSGGNHIGGPWGWSSPAPDMGSFYQFIFHIAATFSLLGAVCLVGGRCWWWLRHG